MPSLETSGKIISTIDVKISHRIIELFSAGLYSSPNKAFEELVCNSYDAYAKNVAVYISPDLRKDNAVIWVCDDGEGMSGKELDDLWLIGRSAKRKLLRDKRRLQIGRFGIGKLATYILTNKITYISKKNNKYLAVTMDYQRIQSDDDNPIKLDKRELTKKEAESILNQFIIDNDHKLISFELFGKNAAKSWTFAILTSLKAKAIEIQDGRLKWILSTALPLSPSFNLLYNGETLESSKKKSAGIKKTWIFGKDDKVISTNKKYSFRKKNDKYFINLPNIKNIFGYIELYEDSLLKNDKSENLGRSHGIFLMVRGRLINMDDALLGMPAITHGVFNRTRMVIHADGLDDYITSTREAIKDSMPLNDLKEYINKKFNEVKSFYFEYLEKNTLKDSILGRVSQTSLLVSRKPLLNFAEKFFKKEILNPQLIEKPSLNDKEKLLNVLRENVIDGESIIKEILWNDLSSAGECLAKLDLMTGVISVNLLHPFVANHIDAYKDKTPLENIIITEVLTEAHLYEIGLEEAKVTNIMKRRDSTLRQLSLSQKLGAPVVAQLIKDSLANPNGLEDAVQRAFSTLGFEVKKIGGKGKPDGKAEAILGTDKKNTNLNYSFTYDAKSTTNEKIKAETAKLASIKRHQRDYDSSFSVVVAVDYEGSDDIKSAISKEAIQQKVTVIKAIDLMRLLLLCVPKQISLEKIKNLFETCHAPQDVSTWIENIENTEVSKPPFEEIINIIYDKQKNDCEMVHISVIREKLNQSKKSNYSSKEIKGWLSNLQILIPSFIVIEDDYMSIQQKPDVIMSAIKKEIDQVPIEMHKLYLNAFSMKQ